MKFHEHIIRASVPELPFRLTRAELAAGIAEFARCPDRFIEEASGSRITRPEAPGAEPGSVVFGREIRFGGLAFEETVELLEDGSCRTHIDADAGRSASDFLMRIEEPEDGVFFVRFVYHEDREPPVRESAQERQIAELRRLAYESKDRSVLERILGNIAQAHAAG